MAKGCKFKIKESNWSIWQALKAAKELDWFILYKNTHPLNLTDKQRIDLLLVNEAKDLKWIWIYSKSWVLIWYESTYKILKKYIADYALSDDFMWLFRILYWDDEEWKLKFKELQSKLRERTDKFFHIIEDTKTKPTAQEYFFRLIRLVRDNEYNDAKLFLALFPTHRDAIKSQAQFEQLFWISFKNPNDYLKIRQFISKKSWIYEFIPELKWNKRVKWQSYTSHTYYDQLPDIIKWYYFEKEFVLPEWVEVTDLSKPWWEKLHQWNTIYVTSDSFFNFSIEDQKKLYNAIYEDYKKADPDNAAKLEKSIRRNMKYFWLIHAWMTALSWFEWALKMLTNPVFYSAALSVYWRWSWYLALLVLNSMMHLPRYIASKMSWFKFNWDFWEFCKSLWIFQTDIKFWTIMKEWFNSWEPKATLLYAYEATKRQMVKLAEAQFFNIADTAMTCYYRRNLTEQYISTFFPHVDSFDKYIWIISLWSKKEREAEIKRLTEYVDNWMFNRFNNSTDQNRDVILSPTIPRWNILWEKGRDVLQEIPNHASATWHFYRRFMESYSSSVKKTIKEWWKWRNQTQIREIMEQYYSWEKSWAQVNNEVEEAFSNNQDLEFLINSAVYSALIADIIFKNDIHWNWYDEEYVNDSVLLWEFLDLYKLMFFPIEAWERTTLWMMLMSTFDAITMDASLEDNINLIWVYDAKTVAKQKAKSLWLLRWFVKARTDVSNNYKYEFTDLSTTDKIWRVLQDLSSAVHWYWYYLKQDIERMWFEQYTPKTQSAWIKEIFWTREYSLEMFDEINKKWKILNVWDWNDFWSNYAIYNLPIRSEYEIWSFASTSWFEEALRNLSQSRLYHEVMNWKLPDNTTDDEYYIFYNMMTQYNPRSLDQIWLNFLVDWSWTDDDWKEAHNYNKEAVEKIWHDLMIDNVDKNLLKEAVRLFTTTDKDYQWQALSALLYLEADTPWAWQKVLWYLANYELIQNVYFNWKYWYFKKQADWTYSLEDEIRRQQAMRQESINIAKKYFDYEFILDREIWAQAWLKLFYDNNLPIAEYIKDTNDNWTAKLWLYTEKLSLLEEKAKNWDIEDINTSNEAYETFLLQAYATIAAADWNPDWYKLNNFATKLISTTWRKWKDWKLTEDWKKSLLWSLNRVNEAIDNMWVSDVENITMKAWILIPHDQIISSYIEWKTKEEIENDPVLQYSLNFLWWTANKINELADRAIAETVQKENTWTEPDDISLSWVTKSKWKNKSWYSNWKQYYNKHQYLYDQVKYMTSKYNKYYNYLYVPKKSNAWSYYSQRERDAKRFWPALATIKWSWGGWRRDSKQEKSWWSLTQRWWKARPFTNRWDLDKIPDRRTKPKNRRTRAYAIGSKLRNKLIPWRRRYIKARQRDIPTIS